MSDDEIAGCAPHRPAAPYPLLDDPEGEAVPAGLEVIDAHVHLFPPRVFEAIWRWFGRHAWPVRYRLHAEEVVAFLRARGVRRFVGLAYAHVPGMAAMLNEHMAEVARAHPEVIPLATVLPGEDDAPAVLRDAFGRLGLRGVKLHCHVQRMAADDPRIDDVYRACEDAGLPVVIHAGREPAFPAYGVDARALCAAAQVERVLQRFPRLTLVVPHLGADEFEDYAALLARYEHLWLDTTMAIGEYFAAGPPPGSSPRWPRGCSTARISPTSPTRGTASSTARSAAWARAPRGAASSRTTRGGSSGRSATSRGGSGTPTRRARARSSAAASTR